MEVKSVNKKIGVLLLAAGDSSRLGQPKQLLLHDGKTLLQHCIDVAYASHAATVIIVLGANADQVRNEVHGKDLHIVLNPEWEEGMASSVRCGLKAFLGSNSMAVGLVLMVCDQPYVSTALLNDLVAAHYSTGKPIVACSYAGTIGPPTFFHKSIFPELLQLKGDVGARSVLKKHSDEVAVIPFPQGELDIDTEEDFQKLSAGKN